MRIQTTFNDKLKNHSSHHEFIPDWMHDCVELDIVTFLSKRLNRKINSV